MGMLPEPSAPGSTDESVLDAYSQVVTAVAAELTPHVAALQVTGPGGRGGAGSAVVVPGDGLLLTNAHVVGRSRPPPAGPARGRRDPAGGSVGGRRRQPAGAGRLGDGGGRQRPGPVTADPGRPHPAGGRGRHPD